MSAERLAEQSDNRSEKTPSASCAQQLAASPALSDRVLELQRAAGNRAVVRSLARRPRTYLGTTIPIPEAEPAEGTTVHQAAPQRIDPIATAGRVREALDTEIEDARTELGRLRGQGQLADSTQEAARGRAIRLAEQRVAQAERDRQSLDSGNLTVRRLTAIARRNDLRVEPAMRADTGSGRTSSTAVSPTGIGHTTTDTSAVRRGQTTTERSDATTWSTETGRTRTETTTRTTDDARPGTSERRRTTTTSTTDLSSHTRSTEESTRRTAADGSATESSTRTTRGIAGGGGRLTYSGSTRERVETTTAGGETSSVATTRSGSVSAVHGESGSGLAGERAIERTTTTAGGAEIVRRASADGRITVNLARDSDDPTKWRVTFAFHLGGSGRAGVSRAREEEDPGYRAGGSVSGQVGADLTISRVMTEAELVRRLGVDLEAIRSGSDSADRADVGLEGRVRAMFGNIDALARTFANFDSASARRLAEGEAVELSASAGGDVSLSGGGQGRGTATTRGSVGVSASVGATRTRAARVERKDGKIVVTITLSGEERATLGASARYGVATMGIEGTGTDSRSRAIAFELDPNAGNFRTLFNELRFAATLEQLQHFAGAHPSTVQSRTTTDGRTRGTTTTVGVLGVGLGVSSSSAASHEVTRSRTSTGQRQITGTMTGSGTVGGDVSVAGTRIVRGSTTSQVRGTVGESGELSLDVSQSRDETDITRSVSDAAQRVGSRAVVDTLADIAASGLGGYARAIVERTYSHLSGIDVSPAGVDIVVRRAADEGNWARGVSSPRFYFQWMALRQVLVNPRPPADWLAHDSSPDHRASKNLFRAKALSDFVAEAGEHGTNGLRYVLRYWGNYGFTDVGAEDVGEMYEWPPALAGTRTRFQALRGRARAVGTQLAAMGAPQRAAGLRICEELSSGLGRVLREIDASQDFEEPRAKLELMGTVRSHLAQVTAARRTFERRLPAPNPATGVGAGGPAATTSTPTPQPQVDPAVEAARAQREATRDSLIAQFRSFKTQERQLLQAARSNLPQSVGGTLRTEGWGGFWDGFSVDGREAMSHISRLTEVAEQWIRVIRQLRDTYRALGTPEGQWVVSTGPGAPRRSENEPDIDTLRRLFIAAGDRIQFYWSAGDRGQLVGNYDRMRNY